MKRQNSNLSQNIVAYIAERLKIARQHRHLTLKTLSKNLNISCKQLQNYEQAKCNLTVVRLCEISKILDIDPTFFLEGLSQKKSVINNDDLKLLNQFHKITNNQMKQAFINLLNDL